jgi:hypothetical protein
VQFLAFGGLAISTDGGHSFKRYSRVPVLERNDDEIYFRAAHCLLFDDSVWKVWYAAGSEFVVAGGKMRSKYDTRYIESADGIHLAPKDASACLHAVTRPIENTGLGDPA